MKKGSVFGVALWVCVGTQTIGFAPLAHATGSQEPAPASVEATAALFSLAMTYIVSIGVGIGVTGTAAGAGTAAIAISLGAGTGGGVVTGVAGGGSLAASGTITLFAGAQHRNREALLLALKEDAAVHVATEGKVTSELLSSTMEVIREDIKQNAELKSLAFSDEQLAEALIAAN